MGSKRRRIALSCVDCRRRKVRCDRTYPACIRCQKGGQKDCTYTTEGLSNALPTPAEDSSDVQREGSANSWTEEAQTWHNRAQVSTTLQPAMAITSQPSVANKEELNSIGKLQEKVLELEAYVNSAQSQSVSTQMHPGVRKPPGPGLVKGKNPLLDYRQMTLRGRSFKTQYLGPSHSVSILLQFEELSRFVKEILLRIPAIDGLRTALDRVKTPKISLQPVVAEYDQPRLISMIPERGLADKLVYRYLDTFETTYRVLHVPTFLLKYQAFWTTPEEAPVDFLIQLLLVMAAVYCVSSEVPTGFVGRSSVRRETASRWIETCEAWLSVQSQKHVTLAIYQTHILVFIAKRGESIKIKRHWTDAGRLLRMVMAAGMHREPTFLSKKITPFDQEMRRRLWSTIVELELHTAVERGMPSTITGADWDCFPPLNVHDEDFAPDTQVMPQAEPITTFTRSSFLCVAQTHLPLRLEMLSRINSIKFSLDIELALSYDAQIREVLDTIPTWRDAPAPQLQDRLLRLVLYEFVLLLHQPFTTYTTPKASHFYSNMARRDAALMTLQIYASLPPMNALLFSNFRDDDFRAVLSACRDLTIDSSGPQPSQIFDSAGALQLIEKSVTLFEERMKSIGQGFHSYWIASSALSLVYWKRSPADPPEKYAQQAAQRMMDLHQLMVSLQEPTANAQRLEVVGDRLMQKAAYVSATNKNSNSGTIPSAGQAYTDPLEQQKQILQQPGSQGFDDLLSFDGFSDSMFGAGDLDLSSIWGFDMPFEV